ncbi:tetratricopeptide repeat protein [Microlunatus flavus]|uniref:Tetratricopeptide repeat-containing protein n=1 Tax=Microlunatus flavus TaxID=1036181 RepID=A0A1H9MV88_9ACTN|nr:hypothetical protein [Microlunatus flavus]SER27501.1 hypothetical protein SAMN05421756_11188 [Microlunatus flavus]
MAEDWFRSTDWSREGADEFERRLARARPHNRAQYLRIKGLSVAAVGKVDAARELWVRVLDDQGPYARGQGYAALEHLADSYAVGDPRQAEAFYRRLISENPTMNGTSFMQHVKLAEVLIARGSNDALEEAIELLTQWMETGSPRFPSELFRWNLALIAAAEAAGDEVVAREAAQRALQLAEQGPVFPRHPGVGVVLAGLPPVRLTPCL